MPKIISSNSLDLFSPENPQRTASTFPGGLTNGTRKEAQVTLGFMGQRSQSNVNKDTFRQVFKVSVP